MLLEIILWTGYLILSMALLLIFVRLVRGPALPDRVVALELMALLTVGFIGLHSVSSGKTAFLDVGMVLALTAFLAAIAFARYLEKGSHGKDD